jgi:glycosyltransferase involved in cell wall biosynthesis
MRIETGDGRPIVAAGAVEELLRPMTLPALPPQPLVSVLVVNYNYAEYIGEAIESVLGQTYQNFELVICDDGSTDNSCEVIGNYVQGDPRVKLIRKKNGGQPSAMNAAYRGSGGDIICLLDSDDAFFRQKLETVVEVFREDPMVGLVAHRVLRIDSRGRPHGITPLFSRLPSGWIGQDLLRNGGVVNLGSTSGISLRREVAQRIFPLPEERISGRDTVNMMGADTLIMRLAPLMAYVKSLHQPLAKYRFHGKSLTSAKKMNAPFVELCLALWRAYYQAQREYLASIDPRLAEVLAPLDANVYVSEWKYMGARFRGDPSTPELHTSLTHHRDFAHLPRSRRWFWKTSIFLPRPLFSWVVGQIFGGGGLRRVVALVARAGK